MTLDSELRRHWRSTFPDAWECGDPTVKHKSKMLAFGSDDVEARAVGAMCPIVLFDFANVIKMPPPRHVNTWWDYCRECALPPLLHAFKNGAKVVVLCFERGSPGNKSIEQATRTRNTVPLTLDEVGTIVGDVPIPPRERWRDLVCNKRLVQEMTHYVTESLLNRDADAPVAAQNKGYVFTPPLGCKLFIHGGFVDLPPRGTPIARPPPYVYQVVHDLIEDPESMGHQHMECTATRCDEALFPPEQVQNLLEGELACLYYSKFYPDANCMVVTPDGDLIPQLLLMARDRIDPGTGAFRNVHIIKMVGVGGGGRHSAEYIDVNKLYLGILNDPVLRDAGVRDPVMAHCALACLVKNDYIRNFAFGIKYHTSPGDDGKIPHVFRAFYRDAARFASLFRSEQNLQPGLDAASTWRQPIVDEDVFHELAQHTYVSKYETAMSKKLKIDPLPVIASRVAPVQTYLQVHRKNSKCHMMPRRTSRVYARQLAWTLEYWLNNYRGSCAFESPTATHGGLSLYGWEVDAGMYRQADRVCNQRASLKRTYQSMHHNTKERGVGDSIYDPSSSSSPTPPSAQRPKSPNLPLSYSSNIGTTTTESPRLLKRSKMD